MLHKAQTVSTQIHRDKQEHNSVIGAKVTNYETNSVPAVQRTIEFSSGPSQACSHLKASVISHNITALSILTPSITGGCVSALVFCVSE